MSGHGAELADGPLSVVPCAGRVAGDSRHV